jgi:ABC-type lipoprotein export system ATPase subunit
MDKKIILSVKNLWKIYGKGDAKTEAVKGVSFDVEKGEFVSLSGPSGSGKSTTFHIIALLDNPTSGSIKIGEKNILDLSEKEKSEFRLKKIGYIFQHYELLPELTALENVSLPLMVERGYSNEVKQKAKNLLEYMGLGERLTHYPGELSGGEKQRVAIARALINDPEIVLADEPTANLDSLSGDKIMNLLRELNKRKGITIFVINHEREYEKIFDRNIKIKDGRIIK